VGIVLLFIRQDSLRRILVAAATVLAAAGSIALLNLKLPGFSFRPAFNLHILNLAILGGESLISLFVIYVGIRAKRPLIVLLTLAQSGLMTWFELTQGAHITSAAPLFLDRFGVIMALINGLVGGGICLYALGYMKAYHEEAHKEVNDRRPVFFALLFIFMGAMFGIIFSNHMGWLFLFWEITTLCSFLLIGYTQTEEARNNALRALVMNLAGGLAFAGAIIWFHRQTGSIELQSLIMSKQAVALLPAALLCIAGITKSAQLPFSSWLLGAMVAPTPVSALLHSSTMVKAGVYIVLRMSPIVIGTAAGFMVAVVGGLTFLIGSLAAITTSDAKRVLAHSTIANLGLIVMCGGIGTNEAVWAGVLLIIFHAVAKCLLFLCVGIVEQRLHNRDIESMSGLILNMPRLAIMMLIGMAGMFLAPFGMLISKWAVLKAVIDAYPALTVFIVFGSAATLFFWVKWMGKLLEVTRPHENLEGGLGFGQRFSLVALSAGTFLACLLFPFISRLLIEPYVISVYGHSASLGQGNVIIMMIMMVMIMLFPLSFLNYGRGVKVLDAYLGGANLQSSVRFRGSANQAQDVSFRNYYLRNLFDEQSLGRYGAFAGSALLAVILFVACL
jgi:ech hydrogenase subunit A